MDKIGKRCIICDKIIDGPCGYSISKGRGRKIYGTPHYFHIDCYYRLCELRRKNYYDTNRAK